MNLSRTALDFGAVLLGSSQTLNLWDCQHRSGVIGYYKYSVAVQ